MAVAAIVAGCQTTDPYTGESKYNQTSTGAAIGAAAGAALGALTSSDGDREKGVLTGLAVGAAAGGGIGYYMDRQEDALRQELRGTGVQVERNGDQIQLIMPGNITFNTGSADLQARFMPVLNSVSKVLTKFDKTYVEVDGFTDSTGSADFNQGLSERRASTVATYLNQSGVERPRLEATGWGERHPVASNETAEGRAQNRRVEINIRGGYAR
nr:OmpA family protein [Motiliproteus sp. SC1-56]